MRHGTCSPEGDAEVAGGACSPGEDAEETWGGQGVGCRGAKSGCRGAAREGGTGDPSEEAEWS